MSIPQVVDEQEEGQVSLGEPFEGVNNRTRHKPIAVVDNKSTIEVGAMDKLPKVIDMVPAAAAAISRATKRRGKAKKRPWYAPDPMAKRETLELARAYSKIEDADVRRRVSQLIEVLEPTGARIG